LPYPKLYTFWSSVITKVLLYPQDTFIILISLSEFSFTFKGWDINSLTFYANYPCEFEPQVNKDPDS